MSDFESLIEKRRSIYNLGNTSVLSEDEITKLVNACFWSAPSAFNSQSARAVILFGQSYQKFWQAVLEALQKIVPADKFGPTLEKITSFRQGFGTVLFFEDEAVVKGLQDQFPPYKDKFLEWSEHSSAIVQYMVWTVLAEHNIGASLQHYNPLVDDACAKLFDVPASWHLIAQMPFGSIAGMADAKTHEPLENRVKVFK